jgi:hypothetical protein
LSSSLENQAKRIYRAVFQYSTLYHKEPSEVIQLPMMYLFACCPDLSDAEDQERGTVNMDPQSSTQVLESDGSGLPTKTRENAVIPLSFGATPSNAVQNENFTGELQKMINRYK